MLPLFTAPFVSPYPAAPQDDLRALEADDTRDLDFLAGGGASPADGLAHFPRLWCPPGTFSAHGQLFLVPLSKVPGFCLGARGIAGGCGRGVQPLPSPPAAAGQGLAPCLPPLPLCARRCG